MVHLHPSTASGEPCHIATTECSQHCCGWPQKSTVCPTCQWDTFHSFHLQLATFKKKENNNVDWDSNRPISSMMFKPKSAFPPRSASNSSPTPAPPSQSQVAPSALGCSRAPGGQLLQLLSEIPSCRRLHEPGTWGLSLRNTEKRRFNLIQLDSTRFNSIQLDSTNLTSEIRK